MDMKRVVLNNKIETDYYISSDGKLFREKMKKWYKGSFKAGYLYYDLTVNGKRYTRTAHRLVAEAFLDKRPEDEVVNHKDGNKLNNKLENLEWTTYTGNLNHAYETGLRSKTHVGVNRNVSDLENEVWKQYKDSVYFVSNFGRVKNSKRQIILKGKVNHSGYIELNLTLDGRKKSFPAHRVIYESFFGEIEEGLVINHKDGNKSNNNIDNLEKISKSENVLHGIYVLKSNKRVRQVGKYDINTEKLLEIYESCADAARKNPGCYPNLISKTCNGLQEYHNGFIWKYIE